MCPLKKGCNAWCTTASLESEPVLRVVRCDYLWIYTDESIVDVVTTPFLSVKVTTTNALPLRHQWPLTPFASLLASCRTTTVPLEASVFRMYNLDFSSMLGSLVVS